MKKVLLLIKNDKIQEVVESIDGFEVVGRIDNKDELMESLEVYPAEILLATEGVYGREKTSLVETLCLAKNKYPNLKIIYLLGSDLDVENKEQLSTLSLLVKNGIFNIYVRKKIGRNTIAELLNNDGKYEDVSYLIDAEDNPTPLPEKPSYNENTYSGKVSEGKNNVIVVSSIKPGTGKSFISTNIAADIARFGMPKKDGNSPSVVIIEGDLQTLSVGTLLGIENNIYNLREALNRAANIVNMYGQMTGTYEDQKEFKEFIRKCCLPYRDQSNLYALVGSQLNYSDIENINPFQYYYMVEVISELFDVVIVDANSSLEHRTTGPILQLAKQCFFVLDLDYNNIRSNLRYRQELLSLGVMDKIKYVLNKAVTKEAQSMFAEPLDYTAEDLKANGFDVAAEIPMVDNALVLNRMYDKIPLVYDTSFATLAARMEFSRLSDTIWKMNNGFDLKMELRELQEAGKKKGKKRR